MKGISVYYDSFKRLSDGTYENFTWDDSSSILQPSLKCNGTILNEFSEVENVSTNNPMYVGTLTADEMAYAGGIENWLIPNTYKYERHDFYLINEYQKTNLHHFSSLSPRYFVSLNDMQYELIDDGTIFTYAGFKDNLTNFRPSVLLAENVAITKGNGTQHDPYVIGS